MKNILLLSILFLFSLSMFGQTALEQEATAGTYKPWDVSQNTHVVQPKFKAVICREVDGNKIFSDFYFLESTSDNDYYYLSNTIIDGKGVKVENVKKVEKKKVHGIHELIKVEAEVDSRGGSHGG